MVELDDGHPVVASIPMEYAEAMRVADFLAGYGDEGDENIAENIRYLAEKAKADAARAAKLDK